MEAGANEGGVIVEQAVDDGDAEREQDQAVRQGEGDAGQQQKAGAGDKPDGDDGEAEVERRPQRRIFEPDALRIEARRAEPDPVEKGGLHRDRRRMGEREAAVFLGPEEFGDEEADREIEQDIAEKGEKYRHGAVKAGLAAGARRWDGAKARNAMRIAGIL